MEFKPAIIFNKKGQAGIGSLPTLIMSLVVVVFLIVVGAILIGKAKIVACDNTSGTLPDMEACTHADTVQTAFAEIPGWLGILVIVFIAVIVIGAVYMLMRGR